MTTRTKIILGLLLIVILGTLAYVMLGSKILNKGSANTITATSSEQLTTNYFGNRVNADFNGDDKPDSAFIVTQTGSGPEVFFFLAHTLGGDASFLGDRITPQSTEWKNGILSVKYLDRKPGEPMTAKPTVVVTRSFKVEGNTLVEVKKTTTPVPTPTQGTTTSIEQKCTSKGGTWSAQYRECTGIGETSCKAIGGTFNDCASACRHNPDAEVCILVCVAVCTF